MFWKLQAGKHPTSGLPGPSYQNNETCLIRRHTDVLMELCPLRELLRLSTDPPSFGLGFSKESESVGGECEQLEMKPGLD